MSSDLPILVERFKGGQGLVIACKMCDWEGTITPEDIRNDANYACPDCGGWAIYKYEEADRCPNCGKFGYFSRVLDRCCSRVCMLQHEYAKSLRAGDALSVHDRQETAR